MITQAFKLGDYIFDYEIGIVGKITEIWNDGRIAYKEIGVPDPQIFEGHVDITDILIASNQQILSDLFPLSYHN